MVNCSSDPASTNRRSETSDSGVAVTTAGTLANRTSAVLVVMSLMTE